MKILPNSRKYMGYWEPIFDWNKSLLMSVGDLTKLSFDIKYFDNITMFEWAWYGYLYYI